ncbi:MAG TPA: pectin acetylesterase-family hydrolase [Polyangiales bacterium]|nr:pectin acetylesterase-family hydrolase [Polyangiales bacterium]
MGRALAVTIIALALIACNDTSSSRPNSRVAREAAGGGATQPAGIPAAGEWLEILPGGETKCSRGTPYRFYVRGGRSDRILIDFEGGGACWNALTCSLRESLFREDARTLTEFRANIDSGFLGGIYDATEGLPFADWTLVHIPYCTGDIHWGDAVKDYGSGITVEHRGYTNASSALDWVYARYANPENIFVSGCSAGAYGAALHSAYIARHYSAAKLAVLADSGAGIITERFLNDSLPNWNAEKTLPRFIGGLDQPLTELSLPDIYKALSAAYPQHRFAQTATQYDDDQTFFYTAMGGASADWSRMFRTSLNEIATGAPNFRSYVAPGSMHCAIPYPFFYTREVQGVKLADWTQQFVLGDEAPSTVACEGAQCCDDAVCDACAGNTEYPCKFCEDWPPSYTECRQP